MLLTSAYRVILLNDKRFKLFLEAGQQANYYAANTSCRAAGGVLATVRNIDDHNKLFAALREPYIGSQNLNVWLGLHTGPPPSKDRTLWLWESTGLPPEWDNWQDWAHSPDNWGLVEGMCGGMYRYGGGIWDDL